MQFIPHTLVMGGQSAQVFPSLGVRPGQLLEGDGLLQSPAAATRCPLQFCILTGILHTLIEVSTLFPLTSLQLAETSPLLSIEILLHDS
jgi:hypothetical protein